MSEVLALKYRPKNFDALIGQESISQTLSLALNNNRLSHAYLFSGLRGSGKTSTARIFSKALICDNGPTSAPCEVCENCQMANEYRHIDIIEMDAASSRKIDDIRDLIEHTKYKPNVARFKIFIIDEVHMLTKEAFNALLKTLEEPPPYVKFILATTDPLKLPATILSRTQHFRFKQIPKVQIVEYLGSILDKENVAYKQEALQMISRAGGGSLRDSLTLLDQAIIFSKSNITSEQVASMLGLLDTKKLDEIFECIFSENKEEILKLICELESYECEIVLDELIAYTKTKFYAGDTKFSTLISERFFRILSEAKQLLFINADSGFVLSLVFFKMLEALNIKKVENLIKSLEKKELANVKVNEPIAEKTTQEQQEPTVQNEPKEENQAQTPAAKIQEVEQVSTAQEEPKQNLHVEKFQELIKALYDRNYELGECFEKNIEFVKYEQNKLFLNNFATDNDKQTIRHSFGIIKHFTQEIFGIQTQFQVESKVQTQEVKKKSIAEKIREEMGQQTAPQTQQNQEIENLSDEQIEARRLLENPLVNQARELFKPKNITIVKK